MIIVMKRGATEGRDPGDRRPDQRAWLQGASHPGGGADRHRRGGDERGKYMLESLVTLAGVESVTPILKPYKLASRESRPEPTTRQRGRGGVRRGAAGGHRGALLGREPGADHRLGDGGQGRGGAHPPRGRLQAAHLALQLPGDGRGGPQAARRGAREDRPTHPDRGDGLERGRPHRRVRRHSPGRRAQRAELLPPEEGGPNEKARLPQARHVHKP